MDDLLNVLHKEADAPEVRTAIKSHGLLEVKKISGSIFHRSRKKGLSLLIEDDDRVAAIQIYVQAEKPYAAFTGALPFGLKASMTQKEVEKTIGKPMNSQEGFSQFKLPKLNAVLSIDFDDASIIKFLNIGRPVT